MKRVLEKLAEYEKENRAFTLVAFGDSVTDGCFRAGEKNFDAVWHARLERLLRGIYPELRVNRINSGIGGISTVDSVARVRRDALDYSPDLVIVCLGLNDVTGEAEAFYAALRAILSELKRAGTEVIYLVPNMVCLSPPTERIRASYGEGVARYARELGERQTDGSVDRLFAGAKAVARECGAAVCDGYGAWRALSRCGKDVSSLLCNDVNHPSEQMHGVFAALLLQTILLDEN